MPLCVGWEIEYHVGPEKYIFLNSKSSVKPINHHILCRLCAPGKKQAVASICYLFSQAGSAMLSFFLGFEREESYPNREQQILSNDFIVPLKKRISKI